MIQGLLNSWQIFKQSRQKLPGPLPRLSNCPSTQSSQSLHARLKVTLRSSVTRLISSVNVRSSQTMALESPNLLQGTILRITLEVFSTPHGSSTPHQATCCHCVVQEIRISTMFHHLVRRTRGIHLGVQESPIFRTVCDDVFMVSQRGDIGTL